MKQLWENPEQAAQMGKRAEARYREYFTAEKMVQSYAELYKKLVREHAAA
jgi:rhamnosyl/mannosyltransferase